jgi:hypothetical protein
MLVSPLVEPLIKPNPNFLRRIGEPAAGGNTATERADLLPENEETRSAAEKVTAEPVGPVGGPLSGGDEVLATMQARAAGWLSVFSPAALESMEGAKKAIMREEPESGAHAATSLRRALRFIADLVEPPGKGTRPDHTGTPRGVGAAQYKNRLHIYLGGKLGGDARKLVLIELEMTEARLGALIGGLGKAVHAASDRADLDQLYATCWSIIARVAACAELPADA